MYEDLRYMYIYLIRNNINFQICAIKYLIILRLKTINYKKFVKRSLITLKYSLNY